jgi:murein DD-endopeptidase MepM/ murein hydrolase activator NlpD
MEKDKNKLIANFVDVLELILPSINVEEDIEIECDEEALKSHKLENKKNENGKIKLSKDTYSNDYKKEKYRGFMCLTTEDGNSKIHLGVDFSYGDENVLSCTHPPIYSPISGEVADVNEIEGTITIKDKGHIKIIKGMEIVVHYYHTLKHLDEIYVSDGEVYAGESCLGTMGGRGAKGEYTYLQHVHYEIKMNMKHYTGSYEYKLENEGLEEIIEINNRWIYIDPEKFWDSGLEVGLEEFKKIVENKEKDKN